MDIKVSLGKYTTIVVNLPEDATGEVMFTVDGESETATIEEGKAYIVLFDLDDGVHTDVYKRQHLYSL